MKPTFFRTPEAFRQWLERHHATADELWVGYYKRDSGKPSLTWPESVDEALCYGWIDGIRKGIDDVSYRIRFTPRRSGSIWSAVNDRLFKKTNEAAWGFFQAQPAYYRRAARWWVVSAKKEETRLTRLEKLAACSGRGERLPHLTPSKPSR